MNLDGVRAAIDSAAELQTPALARRTRNALARAVVSAAFAADLTAAPPPHPPPLAELRDRFGDGLAEQLASVYEGGPDWTGHAVDALEPLHALTRANG